MNMEHSIKLEIEIQNVSRRRSHSTDKANFGHFTLLLLRTQRSLQRFLRTCTAIVLLMKRFVVAVVVFLNSLMSPNYRFSRKCSDTLLIPTSEFLVLSDGELTTEGGKTIGVVLLKLSLNVVQLLNCTRFFGLGTHRIYTGNY